MKKAIVIKGLPMPEEDSFVDLRVYGNGTAQVVGCMGFCVSYNAEEIEIEDDKKKRGGRANAAK